jgi:hypothetical protein
VFFFCVKIEAGQKPARDIKNIIRGENNHVYCDF